MGLSERVVVTERLDQAAGATVPRAITVVTAEDMERRQARTTPEALEEVAGVFVQKTNHGGGSPIVRGLVGNQVLVLVDGIRLNNATFRYGPNQYLATVDPFALDRVEVVRGAGSVLFGSDALGGVVSVLTRQPSLAASGHRLSGRALARVVSGGMEQSARVEGEYASRRVGVRAGVSARSFGDLHAGGALGVEAPSGYGELGADARLLARVSSSATLSAGWQLVHQDDVPRFDQVRQRGFERWSFAPQARQLAWARYTQTTPLEWLGTIAVTGSWQHSFERRERQSRGSSLLVTEEDTVDTVGVLAEARASPAPWLTVRYGVDVYRDLVGSGREDRDLKTGASRPRRGLYPDGARARSAELFAVGTWSRGPVTVDTGVRRTWASASAEDAAFGPIGLAPAATIGSLAAGYEVARGLSLYGVAAQAFRAPNIDDISTLGAFDFGVEVPSADLRPERSLTLETGVRWTASRLQISTGVWRLSLRDLIDRVRGTYGGLDAWEGQRVYRRANVGDAYLRGFEVEGRAVLRGPLEASGFVAYAYGEQAATGQPMRRVPPLNGMAAVRWRGARLDAEAAWRLAARQDRLAPGDRDDHRINPAGTPAWQVVDLRGSYALSHRLRVVGRVGNLFDEAYRVHGSGIDGMGRHLAVSLHVGGR
jgi:outer membrane receptor protein involved in Fe transport